MNICECGCDKDLTVNKKCPICPDVSESTETTGYVEDIKFLLSFVPDWAKIVTKGLDPTFYGTLTCEGDLKVKRRVDEIVRKYT